MVQKQCLTNLVSDIFKNLLQYVEQKSVVAGAVGAEAHIALRLSLHRNDVDPGSATCVFTLRQRFLYYNFFLYYFLFTLFWCKDLLLRTNKCLHDAYPSTLLLNCLISAPGIQKNLNLSEQVHRDTGDRCTFLSFT
jgi:hypothetical protein